MIISVYNLKAYPDYLRIKSRVHLSVSFTVVAPTISSALLPSSGIMVFTL